MKRVGLTYIFGSLRKEMRYLGGAERRINYIFSNISHPDLQVDLIFLLGKNEKFVLESLEKYINPKANVVVVHSYISLVKHILKEKYDIVCYVDCAVQTIPSIIAATIAKSKKCMLIEDSSRCYGIFNKGWIEKLLMDYNFSHSDHLDTLYPSSLKNLKHKYGNKKIGFSVTPCTLPRMERYSDSINKKNYILFASRLVEGKNPELFINAAINCSSALRKAGFKCIVCGDGPKREELSQLISREGCNDVIELKGYVNMEDITPLCKVFCSLQHRENYPSQALLEAITAGCYCICTNCGDTGLIINDSFGELIDEDVASLSNALENTLKFTDTEWDSINNSAKTFAIEHFDYSIAVDHYEKLFLEKL